MRDLKSILAALNIEAASQPVNHLRLDSRSVKPGDVFVAIPGHVTDGGRFCQAALDNGAVAVLADSRSELNGEPNNLYRIDDLARKLPLLAAAFYGEPSKRLSLVGVTGTNGKSTTTTMIANLAQACETQSAVVGTLGWGLPDALIPLENTTPSSADLQRILAELADGGSELVAMEVSSHGLVQQRVGECDFKAAVFTNLSRDHLDYHGDMESYAEAKLLLLREHDAGMVVINQDDAVASGWLEKYSFTNLICYGRRDLVPNGARYVYFSEVEFGPQGIAATFNTSWGEARIKAPLYGEFNLYNLAGAMATLLGLGYPLDKLAEAACRLEPVAGRMQPFSVPGKPTCVVDYAHTPDALALALQALQKHVPGGVSCVFGCGGDRDKGKRPMMAEAAERYADRVIVTSDNPRSEEPDAIIDDIMKGFKAPQRVLREADRGKAIALAIEQADEGEVVLVAGKGHEDYQIIGDRVIRFCDRTWVKQLLRGEC